LCYVTCQSSLPIQPPLEEAIKELQEAAIVSARFDLRHEQMLKDHAEWLQEHDRAMSEFRERLDQTRHQDAERGRKLDERIDKLVIAICEAAAKKQTTQARMRP
jgi:hypothetical protein